MSPGDSGLLLVDIQEKLLPSIPGAETLVWNSRRLLDAAQILGVSVAATEQYPQGLGATAGALKDRLDDIPSKLTFSCGGCPEIFSEWSQQGISKILVVGIEAHVCVQQTVLDLLAEGFRVFVAADAVASRHPQDYEFALRRMETCGATLTTTEAAMFEWCDIAGTPEFKQISQLVREESPAE